MKAPRYWMSVFAVIGVVGCSTSAPVRYFSLDDGESLVPGSPQGARVAIVQVKLPELVDRSQLVVRASGHEVTISDRNRWAEPLRYQIPHLLARDLGVALNSGRVVALPDDTRKFEADFKLSVDIQRLEAMPDRGVELDAVWRVESRDGRTFFGRTRVWESVVPAADVHASLVASQRLAFRGLARQVAKELVDASGTPVEGPGDKRLFEPDRERGQAAARI